MSWRDGLARWWSATIATSSAAGAEWATGSARRALLFERCIWLAVEVARHEGVLVGDDVVVRAVGVLGRDAFAAVGFVEVAAALFEFVVLYECAVVLATRALVARGAIARFEMVAGIEFLE